MSPLKVSIQELWQSLWLKDPCNKCLVKACCSEKCEIVIAIDNFLFPHDTITEKKRMAWVVIISILVSISSIAWMFFQQFS